MAPPESCRVPTAPHQRWLPRVPLLRLISGSPFSHTQHGPNPRLHSCGTVSGQLSRGLAGLTPPPPSPSPTAPALPRAAATATAAGAAPPPCQLLSCNGDWAAAAEVTLGRGSGAGPAPERTAENRTSGGGSRRGRGGRLCASPSFPAARRTQEPGRGGHPVRPRSGEARPGSPGAGRGGVTAPSARPRGMHRGSRGRRRHSQVSCGKTWRSLRTLAPPLLPLSSVPGPRGGQRGGAGPPGTAWRPPGEPP